MGSHGGSIASAVRGAHTASRRGRPVCTPATALRGSLPYVLPALAVSSMVAILTRGRCYLTENLIGVALMVSDVEHLSLGLSDISVSLRTPVRFDSQQATCPLGTVVAPGCRKLLL